MSREFLIPCRALVVLVGASGSGKSTFAAAQFRPTEIVSSDACRALVSDDERDVWASQDAFELLHFIAAKRLRRGRVTVVDATNVRPEHRAPLVALARRHDAPSIAIVFDVGAELCLARNRARSPRTVQARVVRRQTDDLRDSLRSLGDEGFSSVHVLASADEVAAAAIVRAGRA
jgi:protein phosphatase